MVKERNKKDKRKFKRLTRKIKRLRSRGYSKTQIKVQLKNKNRFEKFDDEDFEEAWNASGS